MNAAPSDPDLVSVIVPVYNEGDWLEKCLRNLVDQTYTSSGYEVIVVDNDSEEDIESIVDSVEGNVRYIHESKKGSYAARNTGIRHSTGEVLAFTDGDCAPAKDWLERGVDRIVSDQVDLVGGEVRIYPENPSRPKGFEVVDMLTAFPQKEYVHAQNFGVTANLFVRKSVMEKIGSFDSSLESGGDMEFGQRAVASGFDLVYAPECVVHHPARATFGQHKKKISRVVRGKISKGIVDMDRKWYETAIRTIPPLGYAIRMVKKQGSLPLRSRISSVGSLIAIHYIKEYEEWRARRVSTPHL